jgi:hypothetical protein
MCATFPSTFFFFAMTTSPILWVGLSQKANGLSKSHLQASQAKLVPQLGGGRLGESFAFVQRA